MLNEIVIWDSTTGNIAHRIEDRMGRVAALAFSPDGNLLAAAASDAGIHLFDAGSWNHRSTLKTGGSPANAIAFAADGKILVGASGSHLLFWDIQDPLPQRRIAAHRGETIACLFGVDTDTLFSAGDKRVLVWKVKDGKTVFTRDDHKGRVTALGISDDQRLLASAAQDKSIFLRNTIDAGLLHRIDNLNRPAECLALGPHADYLACGMRTPGTTFVLWKLDPEALCDGAGIVVGEDINADYLTKLECQVIEEHNLARSDPKRYASYLRQYRQRYKGRMRTTSRNLQIETREGVAAVDEAIAELEKMKPMPPLAPSEGMSLAARDHARDIGPRGIVGHTGTDGSQPWDRISRYGRWQESVSENIAFGNEYDARSILLQLIVDDGVRDRGHRKNIFNENLRIIGVHQGRHSRLGSLCVVTYAIRFEDKPE